MSQRLPNEITQSQIVAKDARLIKIEMVAVSATRDINAPSAVDNLQISQYIGVDRILAKDPSRLGASIICKVEASPITPPSIEVDDKVEGEMIEKESKLVLQCEVIYFAEYKLAKSLDQYSDEQLDCFCTINAPINVWPYIRESIQSTTTRMGFPPLTLDFLRVGDLIRSRNANEVDKSK